MIGLENETSIAGSSPILLQPNLSRQLASWLHADDGSRKEIALIAVCVGTERKAVICDDGWSRYVQCHVKFLWVVSDRKQM
tara:strand:+ start:1438 stop:1680 length:243 start_codon:yes stop_codon:yes gene_type:complete